MQHFYRDLYFFASLQRCHDDLILFEIIEDFLERLFEIQPHQFGYTVLNLHGIENP